ncbi:DNA polymerase I [Arthrobacter phage Molivia]|uniref:DNA polymerase I n=1 Tax=Arthrobacter phage Molivia TaxID=2015839 RepID=A0A286S1S1_9CAUD|nr:DNA polymerase I [Arthrobacter phage Molivia]ASX99280.1 DNA polymerase I [Arthrobacter phage Molivia]
MRIILESEQMVSDKCWEIMARAKEESGIEEEFEFIENYSGSTSKWPVLALGPYDAVRNHNRRVVEAPSSAAIVTKADSITRLVRAFNLLVNPPEHEPMQWKLFQNEGEVMDVCAGIHGEMIAVDIETSGDVGADGAVSGKRLLSVAFYVQGWAFVVPEHLISSKIVASYIGELFSANNCILHNGKFDAPYIEDWTGFPFNHTFDTMLAHYSLWPASEHGLKPLSRKILGAPDWDGATKKYTGAKVYKEAGTGEDGVWWDARKYSAGSGYERIPRSLLYEYNAYDVYWTMKLFWYLRWELEHDSDAMAVFERRMRLSKLFSAVEQPGVRINTAHLHRVGETLERDQARAVSELAEIAGVAVNPNSPTQVKAWFASQGINMASTDADHLDKIIRDESGRYTEQEVNFCKKLKECRGIRKNLGTYVNGFLEVAHDGRVYPTFKLIGAYTGRLSTPKPAIMTLPRDPLYRQMVLPDEGHVIVGPDYGQIEARVMAILSNDDYLISLFQPDSEDFFDALMPIAYPNVDLDNLDKDVRKDMRAKLKGVIYGLSYGRGAKAIAESLNMSVIQAQNIIDNYLNAAPGLVAWREEIQYNAKNAVSMVTPFNFHFQCEVVTGENRNSVENSALAFMPQSTANDICLDAALAIHEWIGQYGARIMATVHDQILVSCPPEHAMEVGHRMEEEMQASARRALGTRCVFDAKPDIGDDWANLEAADKWLAKHPEFA